MYKQLIWSVTNGIERKDFKNGDRLPSINKFSSHHQISRATVEAGYLELGKLGLISKSHGKGHFIVVKNHPDHPFAHTQMFKSLYD
ncbi:winged helix-turn-helix domain-containing protein [Dyadobacter sp. NIV53]|uniref:winged helix-turn-helix domain-containing protein n=1 Tax=Dyadobacter sp. NIV53 TaxID=2861765 RepID=UPI001C8688C6|nr:winged helix-turn-helix domain-containing protein [Dyadobacter sp. NIV53]